MDRSSLADFLTGQYASLLTAAGCGPYNDDPKGFGPALDSVMSQLGLATQDTDSNPTITAARLSDARLLTRYYTLDWLLGLFAMQVDEKTADQSESKSQRFKQIQMLLTRAQNQVPSKYSLEPGDFEFGRLQLEYLEPSCGPFGGYLYP